MKQFKNETERQEEARRFTEYIYNNKETVLSTELLNVYLQNYCHNTKTTAEIFGVTKKTITRWVHSGKIKAIKINGMFLFTEYEIEKTIEHEIENYRLKN